MSSDSRLVKSMYAILSTECCAVIKSEATISETEDPQSLLSEKRRYGLVDVAMESIHVFIYSHRY